MKRAAKNMKLLELFPYGLAYGFSEARPVLLFRDQNHKHVLPVWVSPLEAAIINSIRSPLDVAQSPHQGSVELLKSLGLTLESCVFIELKGHHLYCRLHYVGGDSRFESIVRADNVMSFCLAFEARFFADLDLIQACRQVQADLSEGPIGPVHSLEKANFSPRSKVMN